MARPRKTKPLPDWHDYDWRSDDWKQIKAHLADRCDDIARLLSINSEAHEARVTPEAPSGYPRNQTVIDYFEMRRAKGRVTFVRTIDLIIEDITLVLHEFVVSQVNGRLPLSIPQMRKAVEQIATRESISEEEVEGLPRAVLGTLAACYTDGRSKFAPGLVESDAVIAAAKHALDHFPVPERGRPKGSENTTAKTLTKELADIYENNSPKRPTRSAVFQDDLDQEIETGDFYHFLQIAVEALPDGISPTKVGGSLAALARDEIASREPELNPNK